MEDIKTLTEVMKSGSEEVSKLVSKLLILSESVACLKNELDERLLEIGANEKEIKKIRDEQVSLSRKSTEYLRSADEKLVFSESLLKERNSMIEEVKKQKAELDKTREALQAEKLSLNSQHQELDKKDRWLDMEEKRLRLFKHKLNTIISNKKIKDELDLIS